MRVVLDANIYISALIRPEGPPGEILTRFLTGASFEIVLSPAIIEETHRAFDYPKVRKHLLAGIDPHFWLDSIAILAVLVESTQMTTPVSRDHGDDVYLATAVAAGAEYIVSGDPDLLDIEAHEGIVILSPRTFLTRFTK